MLHSILNLIDRIVTYLRAFINMHILLVVSIISYFSAVIFMSRRFATAAHWGRRRILASGIIAVASHLAVVTQLLLTFGLSHLNLVMVLAIISLLLSLFSIGSDRNPAARLLRPVVFCFAAFSLIIMSMVPMHWGDNLADKPGLGVHVSLSLIAFSIIAMAALYALQVLYLNRLLKSKRAAALAEHIPPLLSVERYFFTLLTIGTIFLTLAIASGFIFLDDMFARGQLHKTVLTIAAWACFSIILVIHFWRGVRGRPAVFYTLIASGVLAVGYFGSRIVSDVLLS